LVAFDPPDRPLPGSHFLSAATLEAFDHPSEKIETMDRQSLSFLPFDVEKVIHQLVEWRH
jgi:hypothetical protein